MVSSNLLCLVGLFPVTLFILHAAANRLRGRGRFSPQILLLALIGALNVPLLAAAALFARREAASAGEAAAMVAFAVVVTNGFAYAYFHFFNMSETGRRVRMVIEIARGGNAALRKGYSSSAMVAARIVRLVETRQVVKRPDGTYRSTGGAVLLVARFNRFLRRVLGSGWR